jgi:O-antigen/teichoic acid export membrane protein
MFRPAIHFADRAMGIILTFILNAGFNLALGLAVAAVLGPQEYGRFAIAWTAAIVIGTTLFDWLRLSTTRFYTEDRRNTEPALRSSLNFGYLGMALLLLTAALILVALRVNLGLPTAILAVAALMAIANTQFEFHAALARARFLNRTYATLVIAKNVIALTSTVGIALLTKSAVWVLAALALSNILALLPVRRALWDKAASLSLADRKLLIAFARYSVPIVISNVIYQVIILVNRGAAAAMFGYADAGRLSLATDLSIRLLLTAGAALDVLLFQLVVRRDAVHGRAAAHEQIAGNMAIVISVLVLLAIGYVVTLPQLEALIVPAKYHLDFVQVSTILVPGIVAFCISQFALNPVFQLKAQTLPVCVSAFIALFVDIVCVVLAPKSAGIVGFAWIHSASLVVGFLFALGFAWHAKECRPSRRDLIAILVAGAATTLAIWPTRMIAPAWLGLGSAAIIGAPLFAAVLIAFDMAGLGRLFRARFDISIIRFWSQPRKTHV